MRRRRGTSIIEVMAASLILGVCLAAMVSLFHFAFTVSNRAEEKSVAYAIGRLAVEKIRTQGFSHALVVRDSNGVITSLGRDGTETLYFDNVGATLSNSTGASFSATITITSDRLDTLSGGVTRPSDNALRTVVVTVRRLSDNSVVHTDGTLLARSGI